MRRCPFVDDSGNSVDNGDTVVAEADADDVGDSADAGDTGDAGDARCDAGHDVDDAGDWGHAGYDAGGPISDGDVHTPCEYPGIFSSSLSNLLFVGSPCSFLDRLLYPWHLVQRQEQLASATLPARVVLLQQ